MPSSCCAVGCTVRWKTGSTVKLFRFPSQSVDPNRRDKWIKKVGRYPAADQTSLRADGLWEPKPHDRICSKHFLQGRPSSDENDTDYLPTIFSHTPLNKKNHKIIQMKVNRYNRLKDRDEKKSKSVAAIALMELATYGEESVMEVDSEFPELSDYVEDIDTANKSCACQASAPTKEIGTQTDPSHLHVENANINDIYDQQNCTIKKQEDLINTLLNMSKTLCDQSVKLQNIINQLNERILSMEMENKHLHEKIRETFSYKFIENDDVKTNYYTGLPNYSIFETVFVHTVKHVNRKNTKLNLKDEMFMTLMKLRHNPGMEDLAYRFGISKASVTSIFHVWLNSLYSSLGGLVTWPPVDKELQLPEVFQNSKFRKVRCIIDCTEVFIERPTALKARAQTYSNYKKHNTIKILIGISPSGAVTFLSEFWGGRVSDRKITVESGLLDLFVPGDVVMADRGFNMKDDFAQCSVELIVPAFTRGKKQLSAQEVEESRRMSRARIHVERVIGRIKDFKIISGPMPITFVKGNGTCKKIVRVVSGVVNINPPLL